MNLMLFENLIKERSEKLDKDEKNINLLLDYAETCLKYGKLAEALKSFEKARVLDPLNIEILLWMIREYFMLGDFETAKKLIEKTSEIDSSNVELVILAEVFNRRFPNMIIDGISKAFLKVENVVLLDDRLEKDIKVLEQQIGEYDKESKKNDSPVQEYFSIMAFRRKEFYDNMKNIIGEYKDVNKPKLEVIQEQKKEKIIDLDKIFDDMFKVSLKSLLSCAVIDDKGKVIGSKSINENYDRLYDEIVPILSHIENWTKENNFSDLKLSVINFEDTLIFTMSLSKKYWLCSIASGRVNFGAVKFAMEKNRIAFENILKK